VISVGIGTVGFVKIDWVGSINILNESVGWLSSPLFSSWVWVIWNFTNSLNISGVSNMSFKSIGSIGVGIVS